jgi:hypothetical protein
MAELRRLNPDRVAAEAQGYEEYVAPRDFASSVAPTGSGTFFDGNLVFLTVVASSSVSTQGIIDLCDDCFNAGSAASTTRWLEYKCLCLNLVFFRLIEMCLVEDLNIEVQL